MSTKLNDPFGPSQPAPGEYLEFIKAAAKAGGDLSVQVTFKLTPSDAEAADYLLAFWEQHDGQKLGVVFDEMLERLKAIDLETASDEEKDKLGDAYFWLTVLALADDVRLHHWQPKVGPKAKRRSI